VDTAPADLRTLNRLMRSMYRQLRERGIHRERPLAGGIDAWILAGLTIEETRGE
jgi:rhodanese-related sulfurtransferase